MRRILSHLLPWAAYAAVEYLANLPHYPDRRELLGQTLWYLPVIALPFYFVAYFLVPRLLWQGHKLLFWASVAGVFWVQMVLRLQWSHWYMAIQGEPDFWLPLSKISKNLFRDYAVTALGVCLKIIHDWDKKDRLTTQLQSEKRDAELQFLRAQIHPHFLFNTLNNLYGLALVQSPDTPASILKLSGLLDFMLYECNAEQIPLEKEAELIGHYIELEKLRFGPRLECCFKPLTLPAAVAIAPLLLLPFVENAFKHGANATGEKVFIKIDLHIQPAGILYFQVENSKGVASTSGRQNHGIGLDNVKKRLALLYPGRHELTIVEGEENYLSTLTIRLK